MKKEILIMIFLVIFSLTNMAQGYNIEISQKNNKIGCIVNNEVVIPCKYKDIVIKNNFISAKTFGNNWRLFSLNGEKLLHGMQYKHIEIYGKVIACRTNTYVDIYVNNIKIAKADEIYIEPNNLLFLTQGKYNSVINYDGMFIIPNKKYNECIYENKYVLVNYYNLKFRRKKRHGNRYVYVTVFNHGIIDSTGKIIVPCEFEQIKEKNGQFWVKKQKTVIGQKIKWEKYPLIEK